MGVDGGVLTLSLSMFYLLLFISGMKLTLESVMLINQIRKMLSACGA